jgi:hypothetical protein
MGSSSYLSTLNTVNILFFESVWKNCDKKEWTEFWSKPKLFILRYLDTIQVKSKILYFKYVLFMEIWLTYGTPCVSGNVFSNFEDLN